MGIYFLVMGIYVQHVNRINYLKRYLTDVVVGM